MGTNYVILMGIVLLLVAVDCSSSDPIVEGNVKGNTGLAQNNVVGSGDPVKDNVATESVGEDIVKGSQGGGQSDTSKSSLNLQSSSNEGENSKKEEKVSTEGKGKTDAENKGDNEHKSQEEESKTASEEKISGKKEGNGAHKSQEESKTGGEEKVSGKKEGDGAHKSQEESKTGGEEKVSGKKEGDGAHKSQEESKTEGEKKTSGKKEGDGAHKSQEESTVADNGKTNGETSGDTVHGGQEESIDGVKGKTVQKSQEEPNKEEGKTDGGNKENPGETVNNEKGNAQESIPPPPPATRNDGIRGEECDPSNMCVDKNKRFAACLRVPGNESPDLSLLIQNKGNAPLTIKISAPGFVQLEKSEVKLKEKEDKKVKVSIRSSGKENLIVLKDDSGECILDFKDFITHNSAKTYVNFLSQTPTTFIFVAAILILASGWICMSSRRKKLTRNGLKYQRMDMDLPVTVAAKPEPNVTNDGWDNSWGDNWDDEEAPVTPSKPVTPSLSSKGLASRRLSKEGWKD